MLTKTDPVRDFQFGFVDRSLEIPNVIQASLLTVVSGTYGEA